MTAKVQTTPLVIASSRELAERINILAAERSDLYRRATDGWTADQRDRLKAIDVTLATLWEERRRARAGHDTDNDDAVPVRHAA